MRRPADWGDQFRRWLLALGAGLRSPSVKQKEAYARYCHTLSAAGLIGTVTLVFSEPTLTLFGFLRAVAMLALAVLLFLSGTALLSEEN